MKKLLKYFGRGANGDGEASSAVRTSYLPLRTVNRFGWLAQKLGMPVHRMSAEALLRYARRMCPHRDFGEDDFQTALEVLLNSYEADAKLTPWGWGTVNFEILRRLWNRLMIQAELHRHPAIRDEPIRSPMFIVSLPRTGTTLLHRLLALDPENRSPVFWETYLPAPAPRPDQVVAGWRPLWADGLLKNWYRVIPDLEHIHPMYTDEPEECIELMANSFRWQSLHIFNYLPSYERWLEQQDLAVPYRYHKLELQILQHRFPKRRWVLKSPIHMYSLEAILEVYPDACVIQTHRDPVVTAASWCSLIATIRSAYSNDFDKQAIGQECLKQLSDMRVAGDRARKKGDPARFFDVQYRDLVKDPRGIVHQIYRHFGLELSPHFDQRMVEWLARDKEKEKKTHKYTPEEFGLNPDFVREALTPALPPALPAHP